MKKWNEPKIWSLGVGSTETESICNCDATPFANDKNQHYCHKDQKWHKNPLEM